MKQVNDAWKKIQQTTFTNWVNDVLRGKSKVSSFEIKDIQWDLQDGVTMVQLLESLTSQGRLGRFNLKPKLKPQKLENLGVSFRFMASEKIKLVNIGKEIDYYCPFLECGRGGCTILAVACINKVPLIYFFRGC